MRWLRPLGACILAFALVTAKPRTASADPPCADAGRACPLPLNPDTARGVALGTGVRASAVSSSALAYNPAALVLGKLYHLEGSVDYLPTFNTVALGGSIVDSSTSRVGAGVGFRGFISGDEGVGGIDGRVGLAFPFSEFVSIGVGARYIDVDYSAKVAGVMTDVELAQGFTMDASLRIAPTPGLSLEAMALNFIDLDTPYAPVVLGGGAAYSFEMFTLGLDVLFDLSSYDDPALTIGGGAEFLISNVVPIRLGYSFDSERELHTLAGGVGYTDRTVGFDFSIAQQVNGPKDTRVIGAFRYYVH